MIETEYTIDEVKLMTKVERYKRRWKEQRHYSEYLKCKLAKKALLVQELKAEAAKWRDTALQLSANCGALGAEIDSLKARIAELEYNAANNAMSIHAIMSTLDMDDETHGIADDMYETAHNLAHKLRTRAEKAKAERDEARAIVEKLIKAGNVLIETFQNYPDFEEYPEVGKWDILVDEWQEREK